MAPSTTPMAANVPGSSQARRAHHRPAGVGPARSAVPGRRVVAALDLATRAAREADVADAARRGPAAAVAGVPRPDATARSVHRQNTPEHARWVRAPEAAVPLELPAAGPNPPPQAEDQRCGRPRLVRTRHEDPVGCGVRPSQTSGGHHRARPALWSRRHRHRHRRRIPAGFGKPRRRSSWWRPRCWAEQQGRRRALRRGETSGAGSCPDHRRAVSCAGGRTSVPLFGPVPQPGGPAGAWPRLPPGTPDAARSA